MRLRNLRGKEVIGMKKIVSKETLIKEAAFWSGTKKAAENPRKVCHK